MKKINIIFIFIIINIIIFYNSYSQNPVLIGGTQIDISEAPWQVSLEADGNHFCGGSILSNQWILTAEHCVYDLQPNEITVHAGSTNQTNNSIGQRIIVDQIILHPAPGNGATPGSDYRNDLALLHLSTPFCFNESIQPITYATLENTDLTDIQPGVEAFLTGWGKDLDNKMHDNLESIVIPIISDAEANNLFPNYDPPILVDETTIAFYGNGTNSASPGDSGGPAVINWEDNNPILIGVCSWGDSPWGSFPSVYADVRALSNFIDANITIPECQGFCPNLTGNEVWDATNIFDLYESFDISGNLTINNATIHMVPGGKINILPGGSLLLNNSTITGCNDNFWDGIVIKNIAFNDLSPSLTLNNGSTIEKAYDAIKIENVHNPLNLIFSGDSKLANNNKAISIFNSSPFLFSFDILNCNFENNGNSFHIFKSKSILILNCNFNGGVNEILIQQSNNITIQGNQFNQSKRKGIIAEYRNENVNITNNTFSNIHHEVNGFIQGAGIYSNDSKLNISGGNNFIDCDFGIKADASFGNFSEVSITNDNYFNNCATAIDLSGISGPDGALINDNLFEGNNIAVNVNGENHFDIAENLISGSNLGIAVQSSGNDEVNSVNCNDLEYSGNGMEYKYENNFTGFLGNLFTYSYGIDVLLEDADIEDKLGDLNHPAFNIFTNNFENGGILIDDYVIGSDPFEYYLPQADQPIPNTDPLHIPEEWLKYAFFNIPIEGCVMPPPGQVNKSTVQEWMTIYCQLLTRYKSNPSLALKREIEIVKKRLIRYFYYLYKNWPWIDIEKLLKWWCDNWFKQKKLYNHYLITMQCDKADSLLNAIELTLREPFEGNRLDSIERISKQTFVNIQRIGLNYQCSAAKDSTVFTPTDINVLFSEGNKALPESAFARALYYYATGQILVPEWQSQITRAQNRFVTSEKNPDSNGFTIYPNPVSDILTLHSTDNSDFKGFVKISNIFGRLLYSGKIYSGINHIDLESLSINDGLYIVSIEDVNNKAIETKKILVVQN